tara:strand:+ start:1017 stop:1745 length:729 start_codon:yes stop_codon:yes gene_type:complete
MTKFKILTPAYNCQEKIINTAYSLIGQTYKNWDWIICDDMSTDNTAEVSLELMKKNGLSEKCQIISRKEKYGEVRNTHEETIKLEDNCVVVRLDAGDWLTDLGCLEYLKMVYEKYDPAVVWTAHRWAFTDYNISGQIDQSISLYDQPWKSSHLKTFRVKDFKKLNPKNFLDDNGDYIMIACDQAVFLPLMEKARRNGRPLIFFPRVMYHYDINLEDPELFTKDRSINQKISAEWIRERGYIE